MARRNRLQSAPMAWGDYDYADRRITKMVGQHLFYAFIAEHRPMVLADLAREPLNAFQSSPSLGDSFLRLDVRESLLDPGAAQDWDEHDQRNDETVTALRNWSERWNLTAPWCQAHALDALDRWTKNPDTSGRWWGFAGFNGSGLHPGESAFDLQLQDTGWNPTLTTWEQYEERVLAQVAQNMASYRVQIERTVEAIGMIRVEHKAKVHFEWLAIYQTSDYGYSTMLTIAHEKQPSITESGLSQALGSAAKLIDLPLRRSAQKGRKPGSRDRKTRGHIVRHKKNTSC